MLGAACWWRRNSRTSNQRGTTKDNTLQKELLGNAVGGPNCKEEPVHVWIQAVHAVEVVMANKQSFTPEEWTKILVGTMLAGMAVSSADPSDLWGLIKEGSASSSAMAAAKSDAHSNELVKAVVADFETPEGRSTVRDALRKQFAGAEPADLVQGSIEILREVSTVLAAKAPGDAPAFKAWLNDTSRKVAEASAERGGVQVSDAEKAMLAEISKALGTTV
jgi:hypothetical protein